MRKTHFLTIAATAAATLGLTAALGFRQPDGIEPPPGPVMDTQPSLASIDQRLQNIESNTGSSGPHQYFLIKTPSGPVTLAGNTIRLRRIHLTQSGMRVTNNTDFDFEFLGGAEIFFTGPDGNLSNVEPASYELDITVSGPLTITRTASTGLNAMIIYDIID